MRLLNIIPIVHSSADLGKLAQRVEDVKSDATANVTAKTVQEFWSGLRTAVEAWDLDHASTVLFQDALPVAEDGIAEKIVSDLASQGSYNHQILRWLVEHGARLIGTESPELLIAEYHLAKEALQTPKSNDHAAVAMSSQKAAQLLNRRDEFIAKQINETLSEETIGVLFLGMMHSIEGKLESDIDVRYPFGQPRATPTLSQQISPETSSHTP